MRKMILVLSVLIGAVAFADHHEEKKGEKFADHKARVLGKIDKRIAAMNEHKNCVSKAADKAAIKACRGKMKEARGEWKDERKERRRMRKGKKNK